ncbi:CRISPR-associated helicase Cas3' [Acidocella sp.]|uniref:CRISPR-associated helicase Cas3' n=1 Tax=Acidocella sp. TaxID=50710 RepID=UPI0018053D1B|nr:CRISPR-associated helicase Cas3' [Acidocella sp.]NNM57539.1 CRISPR-associated helicase Cas3' [Acidocella sp.]
MSETNAYLSFWGKAARNEDECSASPSWHPAVFHMLDVAAVAQAWLTANKPQIPGLRDIGEAAWPALVVLIALHDIGKFSRPFQAKREDLWPVALGLYKKHDAPRHDTAGFVLMTEEKFDQFLAPVLGRLHILDRERLLRAVCGHHGSPPQEDMPSHSYCPISRAAAAEFIVDLLALLNPEPLPPLSEDDATALSWWLAGLTVLADWIGSAEEWFPYQTTAQILADYWPAACKRAERAVAEAGITGLSASATSPMAALLGSYDPTPVQEFVAKVDLGVSGTPALVIIEDQTGSGKTEAALLLAHRLMQEKGAQGLFVALPTMATANALHERLGRYYTALFAPGEAPSLVLAHGKRQLNERFAEALLRGRAGPDHAVADADETASAQCVAWIGADRRRSFLADCGVGTIDQALHGVLPTRHAPLRLFGLSQRVLIIDEAHAYDAYMQQELLRLVEFQARQGGSTIILSATLAHTDRQNLVNVFNKACGNAQVPCNGNDYPLVTSVTAAGAGEYAVDPRPGLARQVQVHRLADAAAAIATVKAAAQRNAAVGWIRNTVDDAVAAYEALVAQGVAATLFHARFAMGDRLAIEEAVQARFGKTSQPYERAHVVVGTQVMEQSLDLDFDVMISDLAPVDLLLQRAGRLWRHGRPNRPEIAPCLYIVAPEPLAAPAADWLKDFRGTGLVYQDHGVLWRSARAIFQHPVVNLPEDVRALVEAVYAPDAPIPDALAAASGKAMGREAAARAVAGQNLLNWQDGYAQGSGAWMSDVRTPTRLSDPSFTFRLGLWENGVISPCCSHQDVDKSWAMSEISLPARRTQGVPPEDGARGAALAALRAGWSRWEQEIPILLLEPEGKGWRGVLSKAKTGVQEVRYGREGGLIYG